MEEKENKKAIELLGFTFDKKDLYVETMKLINGETTKEQFLKDQLYYEMVKAIYIHNFTLLEENDVLYSDGEYKAVSNSSLLSVYMNSAMDTYNKLKDLNKYIGYDFKPFDEELIFFISTQYIKYFYDRGMFLEENNFTFAKKMSELVTEYKHHPFKRVQSNVYNVVELDGINVHLNDLIHKSQKKNKDIIKILGITREELLKIRRGEIYFTKDILYMMFLGLQMSHYEIQQFIHKRLSKYESLGAFSTERDKEILRLINDINIFKVVNNDGDSALDILNKLLIDRGYSTLDTRIVEKENSPSEKETKTILLIGGFGFIGKECIEYFSNSNRYNYKICVLSKDVPTIIPKNVICYQGEVTSQLAYERILSENNIDYIIHLAAISTVKKSEEDLSETLMINVQAPNILYNTILENRLPVKCVIFPSTVQLYQGMNGVGLYSEDLPINLNGVSNDYAYSKYQAEQNSLRFAKKTVPIIITRLSNVYGKNDEHQRLIPEFLRAINEDRRVTIFADEEGNSAKVNMLYVKDLVGAFEKIFQTMEERPILYDEANPQNIIVNIASPEEHTVMEIAETMHSLAGKEFNPIIRPTDVKSAGAIDISKLHEKFDFQPSYDLETGLCEVMEIKKDKAKVLRKREGEINYGY